jgi:hypothetical protein
MEAYERYQKKWNEIMESILIMMWLNNISRMEPGKVPVIAGGKQPAYYHRYANRKCKTIDYLKNLQAPFGFLFLCKRV